MLQADPLQVELQDRKLVLDDDSLVVSQWVRRYSYDHGLVVGDTLLVSQMPSGDFLAHDVVSTQTIESGPDLDNVAAVNLTSRNGHIAHKVPFLAEDGTVLGYIAIYTTVTGDGTPA